MFILALILALAICGTVAAATDKNKKNDTTDENITQNVTTYGGSDPVISGNVTIKEFDNPARNLSGAQVVVNSTSGRVLASTTTDANGHYSVSFFSTDLSFIVTASFIGCNPVSYTVPVTINATDGIAYGTRNFQLTPITGTLTSTSYGKTMYIKMKDGSSGYKVWGGIITVRIPSGTGSTYSAYCIDIFTDIGLNAVLDLNGPLPGTIGDFSSLIDWGKVNYLVTTYNPSLNSTANDNEARKIEAAALQCAIWYFTSVQYGVYPGNDSSHPGYYQYMTYSPRYNSSWTGPYDGYIQANQYSSATAVYNRAWQMIDSAISINYPYTINMTPETARIPNGGNTTLTVTVLSQNGQPMNNTVVNLTTTTGSFSSSSNVLSTTITTNSSGQATITLYSRNISNSTATVNAWVQLQKYGTLLYDDADEPLQNLVVVDQVPHTLQDYSFINFDVNATVTLSQTVTTPVNVGNTITYVVTATNNGPNNATGIIISDILPAGFTAVASSGTTFSNGVWIIPKLNVTGANTFATLTITGPATIAMAGTWTNNTATITAMDQYNPGTNTTKASAWTKKADVTLTQTVNGVTGTIPQVNVGDTITFIVRATNNGPDTATNIKITDITPALSDLIITPSNGSGAYSSGVWTISSLTNGTYETLTIIGKATAAMAGFNTTNTANKTNQTEYDPTIATTTEQFYTKKADVTLTQTGSYQSNVVTFIVTATNNGPDAATNINITDTIPTDLTNVTVTPSIGSYNSTSGVWNIPELGNGISATLNITGNATPQTTITNAANKTNQSEYDPNTPDYTLIGVYVPGIDITVYNNLWYYLQKEKKYQDWYVVGNYPVFMWTAQNSNSRDEATGVVLKYIIPQGFEYICSDNGGIGTITSTYDAVNKQTILTWNIGYMPKGGLATTYLTLMVVESGNKTPNLITTAWLEHVDQTDANSTNDQNKTCAITSPNSADIQVNQTYTQNAQQITYTITVTNNGPDNATGVKITDIIPTSVTWISDDSQGTYNHNTTGTDAGVWNIGTINKGETKTLNIIVQINPTATGTIINTAKKTAQTEYDQNYNNNAQTTYITISGNYNKIADITVYNNLWYYLNVDKKYQDWYVVGNCPTFMWTAQNSNSRDEATGVVLKYIIPQGFEYICSDNGGIGTITSTYDAVNKQTILTWNIGYMPKGGLATTYLTLMVVESGNKTPNLITTAWLEHVDQTDANSTNDQNKTCAITSPNSADIQVNQTYTQNAQQITYTITVTNNGPDNATGVKITDIIPTSVTWISDDSQGTYNHNTTGTDAGVWNIGTINKGETKTLNIIVQINPTATGTIINTAKKTAQTEYDQNYNNNAQTTYIIRNNI